MLRCLRLNWQNTVFFLVNIPIWIHFYADMMKKRLDSSFLKIQMLFRWNSKPRSAKNPPLPLMHPPLFHNYMLFVNFSGPILHIRAKLFNIFLSILLEFLGNIHSLKYDENQRNCKNLEYSFRNPLFCQLLKNATFFLSALSHLFLGDKFSAW